MKKIFFYKKDKSFIKIAKTLDGFLILKKSRFDLKILEFYRKEKNTPFSKNFLKLIEENIDLNGKVIKDFSYKKPSAISGLASGIATNGWINFKNSQNQTLDEVYRKDFLTKVRK